MFKARLVGDIIIITTVTVHYSYCFPLQTQNRPFPLILPTMDPSPPIRLSSQTQDCSRVFF